MLCYEDKYIRELSLWIISELGETTAKGFLEEVASQMKCGDPAIYFHSSEIVVCYGTVSDITAMLNSNDSIIKKYGVIAASKVYEKYPEIIKESINSEDSDVQEYSKTELRARVEIAQWHNSSNRKPKHESG